MKSYSPSIAKDGNQKVASLSRECISWTDSLFFLNDEDNNTHERLKIDGMKGIALHAFLNLFM